MNQNYSNHQRKIYNDYVDYSTEELIVMVNSGKYVNDTIDIINDILLERNQLTNPQEYEIQNNYNSIDNQDMYQVENAKKARAKNDMLFGAIFLVGGLVATFAGIGYIFYGAIIYGLIRFIKGAANS